MKRSTRWFCRAVMSLNHIPRYGRFYPLIREPPYIGPRFWRFQRNGWWGGHLLSRLDLFWPYLDEIMKDSPWLFDGDPWLPEGEGEDG